MPVKKIKKSIPEDKYFILCNGKIIKNIRELALAFENMSFEIFNHHVNHERNDFANWIRDIFSEKDLATELNLKHNAKDSELTVLRFLVEKLY